MQPRLPHGGRRQADREGVSVEKPVEGEPVVLRPRAPFLNRRSIGGEGDLRVARVEARQFDRLVMHAPRQVAPRGCHQFQAPRLEQCGEQRRRAAAVVCQQRVEVIEDDQTVAVAQGSGERCIALGGFGVEIQRQRYPVARLARVGNIAQPHQPDPIAPAAALVLPARGCQRQRGFPHAAHAVDGDAAMVA
ncbi:MAG: hypothetical protein KatS3mg058_4598 [Roseiflexus sp.]|nr:MAG: hypothetical protein KatS3mg058_4598 [Roseiflexus sp.]